MIRTLILFVVFLPWFTSMAVAKGDKSSPPDIVLQQAKTVHPNITVKYEFNNTKITPIQDHVWSTYSYTSKEKNGAYGFIYVLWNQVTSKAVWALDWSGDFQPHSLSWMDFDGDGKKDLFFFAGFEDVFSTHIYLWNIKTPKFDTKNFIKVYSNWNDYSVVLDFENDGHQEILDSGYTGNEHVDISCGQDEFETPLIPPEVKNKMINEYRKLTGSLNKINFNYNLPEIYPVWAIGIFDPFRIFRIVNGKLIDVSHNYSNHLQWRRGILNHIRKVNKEPCSQIVDKAIKHIDKLIE